MKKIRVLLADDHALLRVGTRAWLEKQDDIVVVGEAASGQEALDKVAELRPHVVVMDIAMPGMDGVEATKRIKQLYPKVYVLALTMLEDERFFFHIVQAGASGFISKGGMPDELVSAVRSVAAGQVYLYPELAKTLVGECADQAGLDGAVAAGDGLTEREREVLRLTAQGQTAGQIAEQLQVGVRTVERHRENLMAKLDLHNRAALMKYAMRKGLIDAD
jgi:two-component system, NarL family, response regulator NreC